MRSHILKLLLLVLTCAGFTSMIYRPADMHLWDTWCYFNEGTWYMYILKSEHWHRWDGFNVNTSKDGVHWEYQGRGLEKGEGMSWLLTGSVWKSPYFEKDRKFLCNFTEMPENPPRHIAFAESKDLIHWKRLDVIFHEDPRWYEEKDRWDCIYPISRPGGGYYGYWTAKPKGVQGGFGFGETDDGIHWRALPPPEMDWGNNPIPKIVEVSSVEKVGERYYAMVGTNGTPTLKTFPGEMVTFTADKPQGPFQAEEKNFSLLRGDCYFSRFFPTPQGLLVSHHLYTRISRAGGMWGRCTYIAPLKRVLVDEEGTMRLGWWEGNNTLKGEKYTFILNRSGQPGSTAPACIEKLMDIRRGTIIEGVLSFSDPSSGVINGVWIETVDDPCGAIRILSSHETIGGLTDRNGSGFTDEGMDRLKDWQHIERDLPVKSRISFRLLVRHSNIELYLDDYLFNVYSLPEPFTGRIGFLDNGAGVSDLRIWTMTLPDELPPRSSYFPGREK